MSSRRRLIFALLPFALIAYACSSDPGDVPEPETPDAGEEPEDVTPPVPGDPTKDAGDKLDAGSDAGDDDDAGDAGDDAGDAGDAGDGGDAGDAGDGGGVLPPDPDDDCEGNPLTEDGLTPAGGYDVPAVDVTEIVFNLPVNIATSFMDGPQWTDEWDGALVFSQLFSDPPSVYRIAAGGGQASLVRSAAADTYLIGNAVKDGDLLTTVSRRAAGATAAIAVRSLGMAGANKANLAVGASTNPNALVVGRDGNIYFVDPQYQTNPAGATGLYRIAPGGAVTAVETFAANNVHRLNGIAITEELDTLYVSNSEQRQIRKYAVAMDGAVTLTTAAFLATAANPDGVAVDKAGNIWIAEAAAGGGQSGLVEIFAPDGTKLGKIDFPTTRPTDLAFGGADDKTVFITTQDKIFTYTTKCAGVR